jgi:hypothetical protein
VIPLGLTVDDMLRLRLELDVWERNSDRLIVAADDGVLNEMERTGLARIERISTVRKWVDDKSQPD